MNAIYSNSAVKSMSGILKTASAVLVAMTVAFVSVTASANNAATTFSAAPAPVVTSVCPFCSAIALTFSEQLNNNDIVVVASLIEPPNRAPLPNGDFPKADFEILKILKGKKFVGEGMKFKTQLVGVYPAGQKFLIMGVDPPKVAWTTPMKASDRVFEYLSDIQTLPEKGPERLAFFQDYFEDKESVLAFDAYDEFARADYKDMIALKDKMNHEKLVGWVKSKDTSVNRRRMYFTMLGICGTKDDIEMLEGFITSDSRKKRAGLDALIACYLNLKGESGVDLIQKTFIEDKDADYVDTLAAVSALRFHGTEVDLVSKKRIVEAVRHLLDRPKMADMIIPDLARWEDWSVMERLVKMFKDADPESNWLRVPVITYLRACPKPEAKTYIAELQKIDPEAVQRADFFLGFDDDDDWGDEDSEEEETPPKTETKDATETENTKDTADEKVEKTSSNDLPVQPVSTEKYVVKKIPVQDQGTFAIATDANASTDSAIPATLTVAPSEDFPVAEMAFVSTNAAPTSNASIASQTTALAPALSPTPIPASPTPVQPAVAPIAAVPNMTLSIIFIPMAASVLIFLLLWSVVNGWFERLIF